MTLPYQEYERVRCPHCNRRIAAVPDGDDGVRVVKHVSGLPRERRAVCPVSEQLVVRDRSGRWRVERNA